eukprot:5938430-Karenia_brevis.AAC.1
MSIAAELISAAAEMDLADEMNVDTRSADDSADFQIKALMGTCSAAIKAFVMQNSTSIPLKRHPACRAILDE